VTTEPIEGKENRQYRYIPREYFTQQMT